MQSESPTVVKEPAAPASVAAVPKTATVLKSGLAYEVLTPGTGTKHPEPTDVVVINYDGWTTNGQLFESTRGFRQPKSFLLQRTIPGWQEGIAQMTQGERRRFWIPEALAFNKQGGQPPGMLVFEIELVEFREPLKPPAAPHNLKGDDSSIKLPSGVRYKVLAKNTEKDAEKASESSEGPDARSEKKTISKINPKANQVVSVRYTAWDSAGKVIDSTEEAGEPVSVVPAAIMPAWAEVLVHCTEHEKVRVWVPKGQDYPTGSHRDGPFVFDIELVKIF